MSNYYQTKSDLHHKQWEAAINSGKEIAANYHMQEYLNYQALLKQSNDV